MKVTREPGTCITYCLTKSHWRLSHIPQPVVVVVVIVVLVVVVGGGGGVGGGGASYKWR